jgi:hypothetical protein
VIEDLDTFEPCGLYDDEIQWVIDSSSMSFVDNEDIGRKDPETGRVWTLAWVCVREEEEESEPEPVREDKDPEECINPEL